MYEKFYGFKENPFRMTPDSKFFYPSSKHTEALSSLLYTIQQRKGFVVITGPRCFKKGLYLFSLPIEEDGVGA